MDERNQIEEMARHLCCDYNENCYKDCNASHECYVEEVCRALYNACYRKQSEGEWVSVEGDVVFKCSNCEAEISTSWDYENEDMFAYCPCCGANMKGE